MLEIPNGLSNDQILAWESLASRIVTLNERAWDRRVGAEVITSWLENFDGRTGNATAEERLGALYMLSQFMYFGSREIRVLLQALYRDLFLLPLAHEVKARTGSVSDFNSEMNSQISKTRFLGLGNPSESGVHLLYYFRQENLLSKSDFIDAAQMYKNVEVAGERRRVARYDDVERYIFIDDMCGSGETAVRYSNDVLPDLLDQKPGIEVSYLCLFGTKAGMDRVRGESRFGQNAAAVFELDESYKWCSKDSRFKAGIPVGVDPKILDSIALTYGSGLSIHHPLGYLDGQLLLGFFHNTPDNTMPVIWADAYNSGTSWYPAFRRYPKV